MKLFLIYLITLSFIIGSCSERQIEEETYPKTPEELRAELKKIELLNPLNYLSDKDVTLKPKIKKVRDAGLFRDAEYANDGAIIKGYIINSSTLAKFKDVKVKVSYYSKTETLIGEKSYIIYEFYKPNSSKSFSIKVKPPKAFKTFGFEVIGAQGVFE